jgi:hypothetical protein
MGDATRRSGLGAGLSKQQYIEPSSSTAGFFQEPPKLANGLQEDGAFRRVLDCM